MEATDHTPESAFSQIMLLAESATKRLSVGHRKNDLTDAVGTLLYLGRNFLKQAQSLQTLGEQEKDAVSCYGLIRMQADNLYLESIVGSLRSVLPVRVNGLSGIIHAFCFLLYTSFIPGKKGSSLHIMHLND